MSMFRPSLSPLVAALALLTVFSWTPAHATDDALKAEVEALVEKIDALRDEPDAGAMKEALASLVTLHEKTEDKGLRGDLQKAAGEVAGDDDLSAERLVAIAALGEIQDPKGAWKYLKKLLPDRKDEEVSEFGIAAIDAVGRQAPKQAIKPLVELMEKAKDPNASKHAILALANYGTSKRRAQILESMLDTMKLSKPGRSMDKQISQTAQARWSAIEGPLVEALNKLTGQNENSSDMWLSMFKNNKKRIKDLFVDAG